MTYITNEKDYEHVDVKLWEKNNDNWGWFPYISPMFSFAKKWKKFKCHKAE